MRRFRGHPNSHGKTYVNLGFVKRLRPTGLFFTFFFVGCFAGLTASCDTSFAQPVAATSKDVSDCETLPQKSNDDLWRLADCLFKRGETQRTIKTLRELRLRGSKDIETYAIASWLLWNEAQSRSSEQEKILKSEAEAELDQAVAELPRHWAAYVERGDFASLNLGSAERAYADYVKAREFYEGSKTFAIPPASSGRRAAIENRIARVSEALGRRGEAVEASCRALYFDPDDKSAQERIERLAGSCVRKNVKDPR